MCDHRRYMARSTRGGGRPSHLPYTFHFWCGAGTPSDQPSTFRWLASDMLVALSNWGDEDG